MGVLNPMYIKLSSYIKVQPKLHNLLWWWWGGRGDKNIPLKSPRFDCNTSYVFALGDFNAIIKSCSVFGSELI